MSMSMTSSTTTVSPSLDALALARTETLPEGVLLCGKYRVIRKLAQGAVAGIWLVRHELLKVERALKRIPAPLALEDRVRGRLERQARIMSRLDHPAAVAVQDCGVSDGAPYLEMEAVRGRALEDEFATTTFSAADFAPLLEQLCDLLDQAHGRGIVHRDLKASKILRLRDRRVGRDLKVLGFGMASLVEDPSLGANDPLFIGTPAYASPEQILRGVTAAQGESIDSLPTLDARCDVYSLGVILYKALSGVSPYRGNLNSILFQKLNKPVPRFDEATRAQLPTGIEELVLACLSKDPRQRPATALEVWETFQAALNRSSIGPVTVPLPGEANAPTSALLAASPKSTTALEAAATSVVPEDSNHPPTSSPTPADSPVGSSDTFGGAETETLDSTTAVIAPSGIPEDSPGYSLPDAARLLGVPVDHLRAQVEKGLLTAVKRGDQWRVPNQELERRLLIGAELDPALMNDPEFLDIEERLQREPDRPRHVLRRGDLFLKHRAYEQAIADYSRAIRLDPREPEGFRKRALAYRLMGDFEQAIRDGSTLIELSPRDPTAYLQRGYSYHQIGDYDRAIADYSKAIRLDPGETSGYFNRGLALRARGMELEAIQDYTSVLEIDPKDVSALVNRGFTYRLRGEFEKAIRDYDEAIRLAPDHALAHLNRGYAFSAQGDHERAIADFTRSIELEPRNPAAYYNRGFAWTCLGQFARSIPDFTQAIALDPEDGSAYANRAFALHSLGAVAQAIEDYTQALQRLGRDASTYYNRGVAHRDRGDHRAAIDDFAEALRIQPSDVAAAVNLAVCRQAVGDLERALADLNEAIRLDPDEAEIYLIRGRLHLQRGDPTQAAADFAAALKLNPDLPSALRLRGLALFKLGKRLTALLDLSRSLLARRSVPPLRRRLRRARLRLPEGGGPHPLDQDTRRNRME